MATLYTLISIPFFYAQANLGLLIMTATDFALLLAFIIISVVLGKPLSYLNCIIIENKDAAGNAQSAVAFTQALASNLNTSGSKLGLRDWAGSTRVSTVQSLRLAPPVRTQKEISVWRVGAREFSCSPGMRVRERDGKVGLLSLFFWSCVLGALHYGVFSRFHVFTFSILRSSREIYEERHVRSFSLRYFYVGIVDGTLRAPFLFYIRLFFDICPTGPST